MICPAGPLSSGNLRLHGRGHGARSTGCPGAQGEPSPPRIRETSEQPAGSGRKEAGTQAGGTAWAKVKGLEVNSSLTCVGPARRSSRLLRASSVWRDTCHLLDYHLGALHFEAQIRGGGLGHRRTRIHLAKVIDVRWSLDFPWRLRPRSVHVSNCVVQLQEPAVLERRPWGRQCAGWGGTRG